MTLKGLVGGICVLAYVGGLVVMKYVFSKQAERLRGISFFEAAANFEWLRDARGRFRWIVPAWVVFWFVAAMLTLGG